MPQVASLSVPHRALIRLGRFFFKYRNYLFPLIFLPVALGTKPRMLFDDPRAEFWLNAVGILLLVAGQGLRSLVIGLSYIQRGGRKKKIHATRLLQEGCFAHSRNPLYVGNLLIVVGLVMVHNGRWMYLVILPFFVLVYASIVAAEESHLQREFGAEYEAYCRRVPRFLPSLAGVRETLADAMFDWRRLVRLEHAPAFASFTAVILVLAWQRISAFGYSAQRTPVHVLALVWLLLLLAYLSVRVLKKRGVFESV